ncbi:hypothetical protein [Streptomyces sp. NPDC005046]
MPEQAEVSPSRAVKRVLELTGADVPFPAYEVLEDGGEHGG